MIDLWELDTVLPLVKWPNKYGYMLITGICGFRYVSLRNFRFNADNMILSTFLIFHSHVLIFTRIKNRCHSFLTECSLKAHYSVVFDCDYWLKKWVKNKTWPRKIKKEDWIINCVKSEIGTHSKDNLLQRRTCHLKLLILVFMHAY